MLNITFKVAIFDLYPDTAVNVVAKQIVAKTETGKEVDVMCNTTAVGTHLHIVIEANVFLHYGRYRPTWASSAGTAPSYARLRGTDENGLMGDANVLLVEDHYFPLA